jgi:uncharacterized membrane protein
MIAGMTYYQILWYFLLYSFGGWVVEVIYHAVKLGKIVNRGFLNGPVCPVYGFGMLGVLCVIHELGRVADGLNLAADGTGTETWLDVLVLFLIGMALTTAVELIAGWLLDTLFHTRWWDYSSLPFNFHGYICLKFSIIWGLAVVFIVRLVHPSLGAGTVAMIPENVGWWLLLMFYSMYGADLVVTVLTIVGLNRKLAQLDGLRRSMRKVSDNMTDVIAGTSISTAQHIQEGQVQAALGKAELKDRLGEERGLRREEKAIGRAESRAKADRIADQAREAAEEARSRANALKNLIIRHGHSGAARIMRAFPQMENHDHGSVLAGLKSLLDKPMETDFFDEMDRQEQNDNHRE